MPRKWESLEERRAYFRHRYQERKAGSFKPNVRKGDMLICPNCGKEFYRSPANRRSDINYCSRVCMAESFNGRFVGDKSPRWKGEDTRPCLACGKPVTRQLWSFRDTVFCDSKCFGTWKSTNWTGEDNPCWRGGHPPYYGPNWIRQQRDARHRDNHVCQGCGFPESENWRALDVHHIVPFRLFAADASKKANALSNLITLCGRCHKFAERLSMAGTITDAAIFKPLLLDYVRSQNSLETPAQEL